MYRYAARNFISFANRRLQIECTGCRGTLADYRVLVCERMALSRYVSKSGESGPPDELAVDHWRRS